MTLIDMSQKEEMKEGQASEVTTRIDESERREGTGNQDSKTGDYEDKYRMFI
jgi:hypothetical protein